MCIKSTYSTKSNTKDIANEIKESFKEVNSKFIIYFASSNFDQYQLSKDMKQAFPQSDIIGCSTAGEIVSGKMLKNSVVAMAMDDKVIEDYKVEVIENVEANQEVQPVFSSFEKHFGRKMSELEHDKYFGIVLIDGLRTIEEKLMENIGLLTNINFIGGSAGDDLKFKETYVYVNDKTYTNATVLALIKPKIGFDFIKTQSFKILDKKLTATEVDEEKRQVIEFNNQSAVSAYADALEIRTEDAEKHFMTNPVGLVIDENNNDIFVRSPQQVKDNSIIFYCNIVKGMDVSILESLDIVKDTKKVIENKINEVGKISGIINFNCILRTLELENKNQTQEYGEIFKDIPTIGFSTYGEAFLGHINQTATMLIFK